MSDLSVCLGLRIQPSTQHINEIVERVFRNLVIFLGRSLSRRAIALSLACD
jgi:hypothetical protein